MCTLYSPLMPLMSNCCYIFVNNINKINSLLLHCFMNSSSIFMWQVKYIDVILILLIIFGIKQDMLVQKARMYLFTKIYRALKLTISGKQFSLCRTTRSVLFLFIIMTRIMDNCLTSSKSSSCNKILRKDQQVLLFCLLHREWVLQVFKCNL